MKMKESDISFLEHYYDGLSKSSIQEIFKDKFSYDYLFEDRILLGLNQVIDFGNITMIERHLKSIHSFSKEDLVWHHYPYENKNINILQHNYGSLRRLTNLISDLEGHKIEETVKSEIYYLKRIADRANLDINDKVLSLKRKIDNNINSQLDKKIQNIHVYCNNFLSKAYENISADEIVSIGNSLPKDIKELIDINKTEKYLKEIKKEIDSIYNYIIDNSAILDTVALRFQKEYKNTTDTKIAINSFIEDNDIGMGCYTHKITTENFKYHTIIEFKDSSIAILDKDNIIVPRTQNEMREIVKKISKALVNDALPQNPMIAKIINSTDNYNLGTKQKLICAETYKNNANILKHIGFDFAKEIENVTLEDFDDVMNQLIKEHKEKQYALSIASKKYHSLYDEKSFELLKQLKDEGVSEQTLQTYIGAKIASYKCSEDFNNGLQKFLDIHNSFSFDKLKEKAQTNQAEIIKEDDNKIVLAVTSFEQSKLLGSSSWCISRDEYYFNSYTKDDRKQYFYYDFNKPSSDTTSMVGVTFDREGNVTAAHWKNDVQMDKGEPILESIRQSIENRHIIKNQVNRDKNYKMI